MRDRLGGEDRFGEAPHDQDHLRRDNWIERLGKLAERLADPRCKYGAETADQRRARHSGERADLFDAEPAEQLDRGGIRCAAIHGNMSQAARTRALADFTAG
jgi:hypothetical protein